MKSKKRPNFFLCAALVLLCLVLISTHFTSGLYARFTTKASGSDSGRTAFLNVSAELNSGTDENNYTINLMNNGGVAVSYSLEITLTDAAYADMVPSVVLNGETKSFEDGKVVFEDVGVLAPGAQVNDTTLCLNLNEQFLGNSDSTPDNSNEQTETAQYEAPFTVRARFTQVD